MSRGNSCGIGKQPPRKRSNSASTSAVRSSGVICIHVRGAASPSTIVLPSPARSSAATSPGKPPEVRPSASWRSCDLRPSSSRSSTEARSLLGRAEAAPAGPAELGPALAPPPATGAPGACLGAPALPPPARLPYRKDPPPVAGAGAAEAGASVRARFLSLTSPASAVVEGAACDASAPVAPRSTANPSCVTDPVGLAFTAGAVASKPIGS